jgi:UDP-N-acetylmuramoylalanine--D-glutamate ligase
MSGPLGHVLILGLGRSGMAAARYCAALLGDDVTSVTAMDSSDSDALRERADELAALGVTVALGVDQVAGHFDLAVVSPGIAPHTALMRSCLEACDDVVSEIEFAWTRSSAVWVAVTGTNGKTTTTALVAHLLNSGGIPARTIGNIGTPAIEVVAENGTEVLVAEVSSFQLAFTKRFKPRVAVLLNITPDHTDWHGSFEAYAADKCKVFANLGADDVAVIDLDDPKASAVAVEMRGRGLEVVGVSLTAVTAGGATAAGGVLALETRSGRVQLVGVDELAIKGPHNASNALAAAAAAHALGVTPIALRDGLRTFRPIEHRIEPAGVIRGVEWFNDSKATNPDAVTKAIGAFEGQPLILLLGGRNKGNDFTSLATLAAESCKACVVFGEAADEIVSAFRSIGVKPIVATGLSDAVAAADAVAESGDAVVLSPACASFDEFTSYEHRGDVFKRLVAALEKDSSR